MKAHPADTYIIPNSYEKLPDTVLDLRKSAMMRNKSIQ